MSSTALLGEVVTWDVRGNEIALSKVKQSLEFAGLNPDIVKDLNPKGAFARACKDLKDGRVIDKVRTDGDIIRFQFTRKKLEESRIEFAYECVLTLNTDSGAINCDENPELATFARNLLQHAMETRTAQDITRLVQKLFQSEADFYPINPRKGVAYFVPQKHHKFTAKVDEFLRDVGGEMMRFPVPTGTEEGNASVRDAVQRGLSTVLEELNETVANWTEATKKGSFKKAQESWESIKYKVDVYAEYLGGEQAKLQQALEEAKAELVRRVAELAPEAEEGEESPESAELASV